MRKSEGRRTKGVGSFLYLQDGVKEDGCRPERVCVGYLFELKLGQSLLVSHPVFEALLEVLPNALRHFTSKEKMGFCLFMPLFPMGPYLKIWTYLKDGFPGQAGE